MNLYQILLHMDGLSFFDREWTLHDLGVDQALWTHIHRCYGSQNRLIEEGT